jgi:hypothetical protein
MLARLVLLAAQLVAGWLATEPILQRLPPFGGLRIFVYGLVAAVVVFMVGLVLSQILRDTGPPSRATLVSSILLALAGAALVYFRHVLPPEVQSSSRAVPEEIYPLLGAVLGYALKR